MTFNIAELIAAIKDIITGLLAKVDEADAKDWVETFFGGFEKIFGDKLDDKEVKVG